MREIQLLRSSSKLCSVFLHGYWQNELTGEHACVRVIRWIQICPAINHALHSYWLAYRRGMLWLVTGQGIRYVDANQTIDNEVTFLIVLSIVHINNDWNCMDDQNLTHDYETGPSSLLNSGYPKKVPSIEISSLNLLLNVRLFENCMNGSWTPTEVLITTRSYLCCCSFKKLIHISRGVITRDYQQKIDSISWELTLYMILVTGLPTEHDTNPLQLLGTGKVNFHSYNKLDKVSRAWKLKIWNRYVTWLLAAGEFTKQPISFACYPLRLTYLNNATIYFIWSMALNF